MIKADFDIAIKFGCTKTGSIADQCKLPVVSESSDDESFPFVTATGKSYAFFSFTPIHHTVSETRRFTAHSLEPGKIARLTRDVARDADFRTCDFKKRASPGDPIKEMDIRVPMSTHSC